MNSQNSLKNNATTKNTQSTKNLSELSALSGLPGGWKWVKLGDVIGEDGLFVDGDWVESKDQDPNGEVRLIQLADIGEMEFKDKSDRYLKYQKALELNCTFLKKGDLLIARMPEPLGRACIFTLEENDKYVTVVDVAIVRTNNDKVNTKFLCYIINAPQSRKKISALQSGSTRKRISRKNLGTINFPLPPLPEQKKIVEKIEELFSQLDSGVAALKKAKEQIRLYRQSVLAAAFSGKLTTKSTKDTENLSELSALSGLPNGWKWVKLGEVSEKIQYGYTESASIEPIGPKFLRITDIQNGNVNWEEVPYCKISDEQKSKYLLNEGDIVFARTGATVGKSFLITGNIPESVFASYLIRIQLSDVVNKKFIYYYFQSFNYWRQITEGQVGIGQPNVNGTKLSQLIVPLCSIQVQLQIVSEIEKRFSEADNLEKAIDESLAKAETLRQSILKQAFEGKLV